MSNEWTDERHEWMRLNAGSAIDGPWSYSKMTGEISSEHGEVAAHVQDDNADFMIAAREDVPDMLDEIERLRARLNDWREWADCIHEAAYPEALTDEDMRNNARDVIGPVGRFMATDEEKAEKAAKLEALAALEHEQWNSACGYILTTLNGVINTGMAEAAAADILKARKALSRWARQAETPYADLSEAEKESDRVWARKVLEVIDD